MTLIKTLENLNKVLNVDSIIQGIIPSFIVLIATSKAIDAKTTDE